MPQHWVAAAAGSSAAIRLPRPSHTFSRLPRAVAMTLFDTHFERGLDIAPQRTLSRPHVGEVGCNNTKHSCAPKRYRGPVPQRMVSFQGVELEHRAGRRGSEHRGLDVEPRRTLSRLPLQERGTCDLDFVRRCTCEVQAAKDPSFKGCGAHSREGRQPQLQEHGS